MKLRLDPGASGSRPIQQAIADMNAVIERCLQTARLGDRQLVPQLEPVDLGAALRDAIAACPQPARVLLTLPPQGLALRTDRQLLFIVLNNLIENACKYAHKDTPVLVESAREPGSPGEPGWVTITFSNQPSPAGWPDPARLFEKYYRSPYARRQAGTGLGLFLVNSLLRTLGGRIAYQPDARHVRFVLHLPAGGVVAALPAAPTEPATAAADGTHAPA